MASLTSAAPPLRGKRYVSPAQLEELFPYAERTWRRWVSAGLLPGCLKPFGPHGRLLIPLDEARRLMKRKGMVP